MKKFSKSIFIAINKIFNVFLILVLFCHQLAWTMQDSHSREEGASANRFISSRAIDEGLVTSQQYLQETEHSQRIIKGGSSRHIQEEYNSEMSTVLSDDEEATKRGEKKESSLAYNSSMFAFTKSKLSPIGKIETLPLRNAIRWVSFDSALQRMGYTLVLQTKHINPSFADKPCTRPVWLSGGSFPIHSESARKRVLFVDGFRQGAEFVIFRSLHLGITGLALYQMYNYIHQENPLVCQGTPQSKSVLGLVKFWEASDDNALLGFFHDILGEQSSFLSNLKYFLFAPIVYGIVQGGLNTQDSQWSHEQIQESLEKLAAQKPNVKTDLFRWLLPLNPIDKELSTLMKNVLWSGNISDEDLEEIWNRVEILATQHAWYTSINALGYAMNWAYGLNDRDIHTAKARLSENLLAEDLLDNMVHDDADSRFKKRQALKKKAFDLIHKCTAWRPDNLDDKKEVARSGLRTIYAQYLLWSLGAPRSVVEFAWPTLFKLSKLYAQATFIQKIVQAFLKAETCPQQPGVSIAGVAPWASDLTQECFEANVQAFNIIPGQPTDTLVGNLGQYYFPNCMIDLDLSNRGLDEEAVFNITSALLDQNITIRFLNLSGNTINIGENTDRFISIFD
ncbi:MAG: hypothetical protein Q8R43_01755, partial [Alphaproteobacteria bacterium]|nr:hypothetical protein [Alphaproteobacteria bacterium]